MTEFHKLPHPFAHHTLISLSLTFVGIGGSIFAAAIGYSSITIVIGLNILTLIGALGIYRSLNRAIQIKHAQLDLVFNTSLSGISISLIKKGKHVEQVVNNRLRDILGCEPEEKTEQVIYTLNKAPNANQRDDLEDTFSVPKLCKHIKRKNGPPVWVEVDHVIIPSPIEGIELELHGVVDITERRRAQDDFKRKDEQMAFIFNSAPIGLHWSCDREDQGQNSKKDRLYNPIHQEITGLSKEEMDLPGIFAKITHPDDLPKQIEERKKLTNKETNRISLEKRYIRKDGSVVWVSAAWARQWDPDGIGFQEVSTMVDITAQKQASDDLRKKEAQLRFIFEASPVGLLWSHVKRNPSDRKREYLDRLVNPAHLSLTGFTLEESDKPRIFDTISDPEESKIQKAGIKNHLDNSDGKFSMVKRYFRKDGTVVWVSISWVRKWINFPYEYQEISTLVDITEQKRISEEMIQAKIAAEEANKAKSQFLSTMSHEIRTPMNGLTGVLHIMESNPPEENGKYLRIAQNSADTLLTLINDILDFSKIEAGKIEFDNHNFPIDELLEGIAEIHASTAAKKGLNFKCNIPPSVAIELYSDQHRLKQVISNLISNAIKFTSDGEVELGVKLSRLKHETEAIEIFVRDTGIGIEKSTQAKLFQAFTQANASTTRKYGGTGLGLSICKSIVERMDGEIGIDSSPGNGSTFWIRIPLLKKEKLDELLSAPISIQSSKALLLDDSQSTGSIPLWLQQWGIEVKHITDTNSFFEKTAIEELQYDYVFIDSTEIDNYSEEIAQFDSAKIFAVDQKLNESQIRLPANVEARIESPLRISQLKSALTGQSETNKKPLQPNDEKSRWVDDLSQYSILLVDDNPINRLVTTKLLSQKHQVKADNANDGIQALKKLKDHKYDLVLMDCMMPEMDGYDATRAIRDGDAGTLNQNIPIIALTANALEGDKNKCLQAGMNDHLPKPIQPELLKKLLTVWMPHNN